MFINGAGSPPTLPNTTACPQSQTSDAGLVSIQEAPDNPWPRAPALQTVQASPGHPGLSVTMFPSPTFLLRERGPLPAEGRHRPNGRRPK